MTVPLTPDQGKFRVLIMEPDSNLAYMVVASLDKFGMECRHASDGNTGLTAFGTINPHLVLINIDLPGIDGWTMCGRIRQASTIPIIMITAVLDEEVYLKSFRIGADECIVKPFAPKVLMARVATHLRRVYRYDRAGEANSTLVRETSRPKLPLGWGSCDACGYMGPQYKFENENSAGQRSRSCPNCKNNEQISFAIG